MNCLLIGETSRIGQELTGRLRSDRWAVFPYSSRFPIKDVPSWDLILMCMGTLQPIGPFFEADPETWESGFYANVLLPLNLLRQVWERRNKGASVCFFAGPNPNKANPNYSAYSIAKTALIKACEELDAETEARFFIIGPGFVRSKMTEGIDGFEETGLAELYELLKWCLDQPKEIVGGRNIHIRDDWRGKLDARLCLYPSANKLRRYEVR